MTAPQDDRLAIVAERHRRYLSRSGFNLPDDLSFREWAVIGRRLGRVSNRLPWLLGDWWKHGQHRYGERTKAVSGWGLSVESCQDYAWVCRKFETSRRREALSFSHHREVAALSPAEADQLLDWAQSMHCSVRELRAEVQRRSREKDAERAARAQARRDKLIEDDLLGFDRAAAERDRRTRAALNPALVRSLELSGPTVRAITALNACDVAAAVEAIIAWLDTSRDELTPEQSDALRDASRRS